MVFLRDGFFGSVCGGKGEQQSRIACGTVIVAKKVVNYVFGGHSHDCRLSKYFAAIHLFCDYPLIFGYPLVFLGELLVFLGSPLR